MLVLEKSHESHIDCVLELVFCNVSKHIILCGLVRTITCDILHEENIVSNDCIFLKRKMKLKEKMKRSRESCLLGIITNFQYKVDEINDLSKR